MDLTKEEKLEELEKLLQSRTLQGSESLRGFLRFVVLKAIENQESYLKEYTIATEVFGRSADYDSRNDSVVRVQAGRLRAKLHEYYASEGKDDRVLIDLPKGHYAPVFSLAPQQNGAAGSNGARLEPGVAPANLEAPVLRQTDQAWKVGAAALAVICLLLAFMAAYYQSEARRLRGEPAIQKAEAADVQIAMPLWGDLLQSREPIIVAFSNTQFQGTAETGMRLLKPMNPTGSASASSGANGGPRAGDAQTDVVTEHYTGVGEVMGMYSLADFFSKSGHPFRARRSLLLTYEDLKTANIVILGSPAENYLLRDLPQKQDFVFRVLQDESGKPAFGIANTQPKAGEQETYLARQEGLSRSQISEDYAVISLLRGLDAEHRLLILAGITTFGTQAAAEYVTRPEYIKDLISHLQSQGAPPKLPPYFQVLVKVKVSGGVPVQISYVTHHVL